MILVHTYHTRGMPRVHHTRHTRRGTTDRPHKREAPYLRILYGLHRSGNQPTLHAPTSIYTPLETRPAHICTAHPSEFVRRRNTHQQSRADPCMLLPPIGTKAVAEGTMTVAARTYAADRAMALSWLWRPHDLVCVCSLPLALSQGVAPWDGF